MERPYNPADSASIEAYAYKLVDKSFMDVIVEKTRITDQQRIIEAYSNKARKGGLGNLLEEIYFGYKANSNQEADFNETGIELKATPYEFNGKGEIRAGERVVITMISYDHPFEIDFYKSHAWQKMRRMLLVYYWRNKQLNNNLLYKIGYVKLFTPPQNDLVIIQHDYEIIKAKIISGKAHQLSESDTMYLGACTKGSTAAKSTVPQYYNPSIPAMKRAFCFKNSYMTFVLQHYILGQKNETESVVNESQLKEKTFDDYVIDKLAVYHGWTIDSLCQEFDITFERQPKNLEAMLAYRILGIRGNRAEEFEKANIVVKTIRIGNNGKIKENMSFPTFKFKELIEEEWDDSTFGNYLRETRFLFVVYQYDKNEKLRLKGCQFWNIPYEDLEIEVRSVWEKTKSVLKEGLSVSIVNGKNVNNFPKQSENPVSHVRPHAQNAQDTYELPDGRVYPKQCFWLNNSYILSQLEDRLKD